MNLKTMFIINTVVALLFGIAFALVPEPLLSFYAITNMSAREIALARLLGAALISLGVLSWFARSAGPSTEREGITLGIVIGDAIGFVVALNAVLSNVTNNLGWSTVALYLLLALGFAYFRFMKRAA